MAKIVIELDTAVPADAEMLARLHGPTDAGDEKLALRLGVAEPTSAKPVESWREELAHAVTPATPIPEPTAPPPPVPGVDSSGLPWDARIHSDSRAVNADGTWRKKRGVADELVAAVTAELKGAPAEPVAPPPPAPSTPVPPAPPVLAAEPAARGMRDISGAVSAGRVTLPQITELAQRHGCPDVLALHGNPAAMAAVCAELEALGAFA